MHRFLVLFAGEVQRMQKYHIFGAAMLVALLWIGVLYFTELQDVTGIFPLLLFIDATSMAIVLVGVTMFFEKQENTLKTLLVSPVGKGEYLGAKICANITSNILTLLLLYAYVRIFRSVHLDLLGLLGAVVLVAVFHSLVGVLLTYRSRDFTSLLVAMAAYFLLLMLPVVFDMFGLIQTGWMQSLLLLLPTKASMVVLLGPTGAAATGEFVFSLLYLLLLSGLLAWVAFRCFDGYAMKESGV